MTRLRSTVLVLGAAVLLAALVSWLSAGRSLVPSASAAVQASPADRAEDGVLVSGTGRVSAEPDVLRATFGASARARTVEAAMSEATAAMTRMRDVLVRRGVSRADLQTSNVDIDATRNDEGQVTGYSVSEGLTAKIRNIRQAGVTITAVVAAGGDAARLSGVSFAVENDDALLADARRKAFADAQAKAELYAAEADRSLGEVVSITETGPGRPPVYQELAAVPMAAGDTPVEPGRQEVTASVTVRWSLR